MNAADDAELMLRFQAERDFASFETLFRRHKDALLRFILQLAGEPAIAEDTSQHAWMRVIDVARLGTFSARAEVTFRTWLFSLARNHYIDEYHRKHVNSRTVSLPDEFPADSRSQYSPSADAIEQIYAHQMSECLAAALRNLPFEQREVIALWAAGVEVEAIAGLIGAPRDTIFSRKKYAIAKLRLALAGTSLEEDFA